MVYREINLCFSCLKVSSVWDCKCWGEKTGGARHASGEPSTTAGFLSGVSFTERLFTNDAGRHSNEEPNWR